MERIQLSELMQDNEIKQLGRFLESSQGNQGMCLTMLHGFLTAIQSGPEIIPYYDWSYYIFNETFQFESIEQLETIFSLITQVNTEIIIQLKQQSPFFKFLFYQQNKIFNKNSCSDELIARWCSGYLEGSYASNI